MKNDLISRRAAIDAVIKKPAWHNSDGSYYHSDDIRDALEGLPSAQPDHSGDVNGKVDLIDRQAAIDALDGNVIVTSRESAQAVMDYIRGCADRMRSLPSAQPEIIRCKDCKHRIKISIDIFPNVFTWGCNYMNAAMGDNDFCSKAERRTDETD